MFMKPPLSSASRGFGMIEVLVSIFILAIGMLGVAAMQSVSLRNSLSASQRSAVATETYALFDAMRANRDVAEISGYDLPEWTCAAPDGGTRATDDLRAWMLSLQASVGTGVCAHVDCVDRECTARIKWDDSRASGTEDENERNALVNTEILTETTL